MTIPWIAVNCTPICTKPMKMLLPLYANTVSRQQQQPPQLLHRNHHRPVEAASGSLTQLQQQTMWITKISSKRYRFL
jgi:hypothetical protein